MKKAMRDAFLGQVLEHMRRNDKVFLLSADFGAPTIDSIRAQFPERFLNVGIAEQNLINVATGLALEGFSVIAYAIAPFITMRCYEQIRVNLAILSELRPMSVTLVGVGAGFSYDVSGPTHHCIEDLSIMSALPNVHVYSPSDAVLAEQLADLCLARQQISYLRFDAKPQEALAAIEGADWRNTGFRSLTDGTDICVIATGQMSHVAIDAAAQLADQGISTRVIDLVAYNGADQAALAQAVAGTRAIFILQEALLGNDAECQLRRLVDTASATPRVRALGVAPQYMFEVGARESIQQASGLGISQIVDTLLAAAR